MLKIKLASFYATQCSTTVMVEQPCGKSTIFTITRPVDQSIMAVTKP